MLADFESAHGFLLYFALMDLIMDSTNSCADSQKHSGKFERSGLKMPDTGSQIRPTQLPP
jgi:hypothetical protein